METQEASEFTFRSNNGGDTKKTNDVQTFLLKKLEKDISNIKPSQDFVSSNCLSKEFKQLGKWIKENEEKINAITLREKLYLLNNLIAEWQMVLNEHNHCAPQTIRMANNVRRNLKKIKSELEVEVEAGCVGEAGDGNRSIESTGRGLDTTNIYGFEDVSMIMERLLVEKERKVGFKAIGIVGVSGVGKTTLCQVAFNNQEVRKYFAPRIWVHLSKQPVDKDYKKEVVKSIPVDEDYKKEAAKSILRCLGYEDNLIDQIGGSESDGLRKLLLALRLKLKGKKYLIFLDGVWNSDERLKDFCSSLNKDDIDQNQLAYGFPKGDGGTVIVMSKSNKLAADMVGDKNLHRLIPLEDDDDESCWQIFLDTVGKGYKQIEDMKKLKVEIVKNCAGLPLVARMLGQIALQKPT